MDMILERFFAGYKAAEDILRATDDEEFLEPNPAEVRLRELFPTKGAMHAYYVSGHLAGQHVHPGHQRA